MDGFEQGGSEALPDPVQGRMGFAIYRAHSDAGTGTPSH